MDYFKITDFQTLCSIETRQEYLVIEFEEANDLPVGYSALEYESKGFMESKLCRDFRALTAEGDTHINWN